MALSLLPTPIPDLHKPGHISNGPGNSTHDFHLRVNMPDHEFPAAPIRPPIRGLGEVILRSPRPVAK
jgi:hypothetical protein